MKNSILAALLIIVAFSFYGCQKINTIDNSGTITEPYSLFIGGIRGHVQKTNDAADFSTTFFDDGSFTEDVIVADTNLISIRKNIHVANTNKPVFSWIKKGTYTNFLYNTVAGRYVNVNLYDASNKNVYVLTGLGIVIGQQSGTNYANDNNLAVGMPKPITMAQLANNDLFCRDAWFSAGDSFLYKRIGGLLSNIWVKVIPTTVKANQIPRAGVGAPWIIGGVNNRLVAVNKQLLKDAMYSDDGGVTFFKAPGLPDSVTVQMVKSTKYNNSMFVGTDSAGLWRMVGDKFEFSGNGLPSTLRIFDIVGKRNVYRTGNSKDIYFLATDQGLFMSEYDCKQWKKVNNEACTSFD
jgi:hypothetical protein